MNNNLGTRDSVQACAVPFQRIELFDARVPIGDAMKEIKIRERNSEERRAYWQGFLAGCKYMESNDTVLLDEAKAIARHEIDNLKGEQHETKIRTD